MTTGKLFSPLELARATPLRQQVAERIRAAIQNQQWRAGDRLPTARELAALWGTDQATVHWGLAQLAREGRIERAPRRGTFVREKQPVLETAGIYVSEWTMGHGTAPFAQAVINALRTELKRVHVQPRFFIDPRSRAEQAKPWDSLVQAATRREIQALLVPLSDPMHMNWLSRLPLPLALLSSGPRRTIEVDQVQFVDLAIRALMSQGCRRIGLISAYPAVKTSALYRHFVDTIADQHLPLRDTWLAVAPACAPGAATRAADQHQFGYDGFRAVWQQPERPDGLIITPDSVATGAILALAELGVRVPAELRLVLQRNKGVPLLCPFPATFLELDPAEAAAAMVQQVRDLHAGRTIARAVLRHALLSTPADQKE